MNTREKGKRAVVAVMAAVGLLLGICATVRSVQTSAQLEAEVALLTEQMQEKDIKIAALKEQTRIISMLIFPGVCMWRWDVPWSCTMPRWLFPETGRDIPLTGYVTLDGIWNGSLL